MFESLRILCVLTMGVCQPRTSRVTKHNSASYSIVSLKPDSSVTVLLSYFDYVLVENFNIIKHIKYLL